MTCAAPASFAPLLPFQVDVLVGLNRQTSVASRCIPRFLCIALPCHTSLRGNFCCVEEMLETLSCCGQRNCTFWLYRPSPFPRNNLPPESPSSPGSRRRLA